MAGRNAEEQKYAGQETLSKLANEINDIKKFISGAGTI